MELIDFILHVDVYLGRIIASYGELTYAILFSVIFAETGLVLTPFLPGDSLLFSAGMFAALDALDIWTLFFLLWAASFLGDNVNYWVGYYFGQKIVDNHRIPINQSHIDKTQDFFREHGKKTIILARFMPIVRTFAPFVAGIGRMEYGKFVPFSFLGGLAWVSIFVLGGYFFGNIPLVRDNFPTVIMIIIAISVLPALVRIIGSKLKTKR
ncbi:MAG: DedA family protein [Candidatus Moranbacteria bacterium]|nr:DedA family protein [Candidatus Moranbacteria bacterium]